MTKPNESQVDEKIDEILYILGKPIKYDPNYSSFVARKSEAKAAILTLLAQAEARGKLVGAKNEVEKFLEDYGREDTARYLMEDRLVDLTHQLEKLEKGKIDG